MSILKNTQWLRKQKAQSGTYGLEIETESGTPYVIEAGMKFGEYNFPGIYKLNDWKIVEDHSLRNFGYEYVLTKPLSFEDTRKALIDFAAKTEEQKIEFLQGRHSTSIHVHVNFQSETFKTLGNFITLFTLFEEVLVRYCGEERRSNFFCLTSKYANGLTRRFVSFFEKVYNADKNTFGNLNDESSKYSSLNIVPLYRQGSIEVRTMRGVTDVATIYKWVGMLNALLEFARQDLTPLDIIQSWRQEGILLFDEIFQEYLEELALDGTEALIERNLWAAASVACSVPDWNKIDSNMKIAQDEFDRRQKEKKALYDDDFPVNVAPMAIQNWGEPIMAEPPEPQDDEGEF